MAAHNTVNKVNRFVTVFALPLHLDKFVTILHPDSRICSQHNFFTVINLWLRNSLYRDTAPVPANSFVTGDRFLAPIYLVPRNGSNSTKLLLWMQKHAPYSPCTVTASRLKYQDSARMPRRVTQPPFIAVRWVQLKTYETYFSSRGIFAANY